MRSHGVIGKDIFQNENLNAHGIRSHGIIGEDIFVDARQTADLLFQEEESEFETFTTTMTTTDGTSNSLHQLPMVHAFSAPIIQQEHKRGISRGNLYVHSMSEDNFGGEHLKRQPTQSNSAEVVSERFWIDGFDLPITPPSDQDYLDDNFFTQHEDNVLNVPDAQESLNEDYNDLDDETGTITSLTGEVLVKPTLVPQSTPLENDQRNVEEESSLERHATMEMENIHSAHTQSEHHFLGEDNFEVEFHPYSNILRSNSRRSPSRRSSNARLNRQDSSKSIKREASPSLTATGIFRQYSTTLNGKSGLSVLAAMGTTVAALTSDDMNAGASARSSKTVGGTSSNSGFTMSSTGADGIDHTNQNRNSSDIIKERYFFANEFFHQVIKRTK